MTYTNNINEYNIILFKRFNLIKILNIIIIIKKRYSLNNIIKYREFRKYIIIIIKIIKVAKFKNIYNELNIIKNGLNIEL